MDRRIEKLKKFRQFLLDQLKELTDEQLNEIPKGFRNNIIWNLAHMTCAQQSICYIRSSLKPIIAGEFIAPFLTNTKPEGPVSAGEIREIKDLFLSVIERLQSDYKKGCFSNYSASPNILRIYGVELKTIEDSFDFLAYHDGLHSGTIIALKKHISINN